MDDAYATHGASSEEEEEDGRTEKIRRICEMQQEIRAWHTFHSLGDDTAPADAARALAEYRATQLFASEPCAAREWYEARISSHGATSALELREAMLAMFPVVATMGDAQVMRQWKSRWRSLQRQWPDIFIGDGTWMDESVFGSSRGKGMVRCSLPALRCSFSLCSCCALTLCLCVVLYCVLR